MLYSRFAPPPLAVMVMLPVGSGQPELMALALTEILTIEQSTEVSSLLHEEIKNSAIKANGIQNHMLTLLKHFVKLVFILNWIIPNCHSNNAI